MGSSLKALLEYEEPLPSRRSTLWLAAAGTGLAGAALLLGSDAQQGLDGWRAVLAMLGLLVTGMGISQRSSDPCVWAFGCAASLLAVGGFPASWDSFRLVAGVLAGVSLAAMIVLLLPRNWWMAVASALVVFHLIGIFTAITGSRDQPWLFGQLWARVYRPYLLFIWQNNSYQFFAPDPGAPSELWFEIEYNASSPESRFDWVVVPRRSDMRDPLLNSYYRRIIIPEQASYGFNPTALMESELVEMNLLRESSQTNPVTGEQRKIPHHSSQPAANQLLIPNPAVQRLTVPSYVQHVASSHQRPGESIKQIRVYRVLHTHVVAEHFVGAIDEDGKQPRRITPYDPTSYLAYYLGSYDASGKILPGADPMLWWMIPILAKPDLHIPPVYFREISPGDYDAWFVDDVKFHAGSDGYRKGP